MKNLNYKQMKIIFMGTPDFAIPSLQKILESKHELRAVVTAPDKERGRGQKVSYTPVKEFAIKNNIPVLQPDNLRNEDFISQLKTFNADIFVIVAFKILPREIFTIPPKGSFNLHASLLPKYRGAAPIQWALIRGEKKTGVTTFALEDKVDTGNIYIQEKIEIDEEDNFGSLHDKLSILGANVVIRTLDLIETGNFEFKLQDNSLATSAAKITKNICKIDWQNPAQEIHNLIRGLSPMPGAYFSYENKIIKVYKSKIMTGENMMPGKIVSTKNRLVIGCGKDTLSIEELQLEGKKKLTVDAFLRGFKFN